MCKLSACGLDFYHMPVKTRSPKAHDCRVKDFLTAAEIEEFLTAARKGTHGPRDFLLALLAYRHGFRVSELIDVRLEELDLKTARLFVRRLKGSLSTEHPLEGDELRAIRRAMAQIRRDRSEDPVFRYSRGTM